MKGIVIRAKEARIHGQELMHFKRSFTEPVAENREGRFAKSGIETFHGLARFILTRFKHILAW